MGNISFYHRDGKCYWRTKPTASYPGTPTQMIHAAIHSRALKAWRGLDHNEQLEWSAIATAVPSKRPPFNPEAHISGYNLFISAYHGFAQLGDERIPAPKPYIPFPEFSITYISALQIEEKDLLLTFSKNTDNRFRIVTKIQLTYPGSGIRPGLMRSFLPVPMQDNPERIALLIPDHKETWHLDLPEYQAHIRYFLTDTKTGYRSQEKQISVRFEV